MRIPNLSLATIKLATAVLLLFTLLQVGSSTQCGQTLVGLDKIKNENATFTYDLSPLVLSSGLIGGKDYHIIHSVGTYSVDWYFNVCENVIQYGIGCPMNGMAFLKPHLNHTYCHRMASSGPGTWSFLNETDPRQGVTVKWDGGDYCSYGKHRSFTINFKCGTMRPGTFSNPRETAHLCENTLDWETIYACPIVNKPPPVPIAKAKPISWRLLSGVTHGGENSVCGKIGEFSSKFAPGARAEAAMTVVTKTSDHQVFLVGGMGFAAEDPRGLLGDVWSFRQNSWSELGEWAWIGGKSDKTGYRGHYYGPKQYMGAREALIAWTCEERVFIFGGLGVDVAESVGTMDDVWTFDAHTHTWKWLKGSSLSNQHSNFGHKGMGVADAANTPGGSFEPCMLFENEVNGKSEMLVFGGISMFRTGFYTRQELHSATWKYSETENMWTWVNGPAIPNYHSVVGRPGEYSKSHYPGARSLAAVLDTIHTKASHLSYIFGGYGRSTRSHGLLADLWAFDSKTYEWAFIAGESAEVNNLGVYGEKGAFLEASLVHPGARIFPQAWADSNSLDLIHIFGGEAIAHQKAGFMNDVWSFNTTCNAWAWTGGESFMNARSELVDADWFSTQNAPGARDQHVAAINPEIGLMYLFGGYTDVNAPTLPTNELWVSMGPTRDIGPSPTPTPAQNGNGNANQNGNNNPGTGTAPDADADVAGAVVGGIIGVSVLGIGAIIFFRSPKMKNWRSNKLRSGQYNDLEGHNLGVQELHMHDVESVDRIRDGEKESHHAHESQPDDDNPDSDVSVSQPEQEPQELEQPSET